ncbi:hypothetical protein EW145_g4865, partial [Phellinidium pouzarii]
MPTHELRKADCANTGNPHGGVRAVADPTSTRTPAPAGRARSASSHASSPGLPSVSPLPPIPQSTRSILPAGAAAPTTLIDSSQPRTSSTRGSRGETSGRSVTDVKQKDETAASGDTNLNMGHAQRILAQRLSLSLETRAGAPSAPSISTPEESVPTQDTHMTSA